MSIFYKDPLRLPYELQLIAMRKYGEPRLIKPIECNNSTQIGSVKWKEVFASCKIYFVEETRDVFILHRDWYSEFTTRQEYNKKVDELNKLKINGRFVYLDGGNTVVLRNEAMLKFYLPKLELFNNYTDYILRYRLLLTQQWAKNIFNIDYYDNNFNYCEVERFIEEVLKLLWNNQKETKE
ncbi:MAG: hypothetical protein RR054_04435 [Clostridia bacterium]